MKKSIRRLSAVLLFVFLSVSALSGCGAAPSPAAEVSSTEATASSASQEATPAASTETAASAEVLPEVELVYYFVNSPQNDLESVNAEINRQVKGKINATVKMNLIDWGAFDQKMNVVAASGEPCDLVFTATWANNIYQNIAKGTLAPLNDLIDTYAPKTKETVPETFWKVVTVKGQIYAVPNFQQATAGYGILVQKAIADKYGFDWKSVTSLSGLEPLLEQVKANEPDMIPYGTCSGSAETFINSPPMFAMEAVGDSKTPGWLYLKDDTLKVINQYDTPEFKTHIVMMRRWYEKGYIRKDVATLTDINEDLNAGKVAAKQGQIDLDSLMFEQAGLPFDGRMMMNNQNTPSYDLQFVKPLLTTDKAAATNTGIMASSQNKERAMMLIELMNTDKMLYNTFCWGIEGKHYKKINDVGDGRIETIKDGGYQIFSAWEFGNMENSYLSESHPIGGEVDGKFTKMWSSLNRNAPASNALGFVFDMTPVKTEIASCQAVLDELYYAVALGSVDPDKYQPILVQKLKDAGSETIMAEKQKQLDAWKATR